MILAAGIGSRLGYLTQELPKAMVKVGNIPMIDRLLFKLKEAGIEEVMISLHHFPDRIRNHVDSLKIPEIKIQYSEERDLLLDTGGALVAAESFFSGNRPVLIHNVDILTNLDIAAMEDFHLKTQAEATLFVSNRPSSRSLIFNKDFHLIGWTNKKSGEKKWVSSPNDDTTALAFNGVWITQPDFIQQLPFKGKFSIIDAWLHMAKKNEIRGYLNNQVSWHDLGTIEKIKHAEEQLNLKTL